MKMLMAIDDTDNEESIGTGRLARMLADELERCGLFYSPSVTRHQLLVHPDIPYTSHNSSACIGGTLVDSDMGALAERARSFLQENFHEGANPGLCLMSEESVPDQLRDFGRRAQREVIPLADVENLADIPGLFLWSSGETGQGRIGALAGVGLRSTGNDGRFIGLKGIREIEGVVTVSAIIEKTSVVQVVTAEDEILAGDERIDTQDWVRPTLRNGNPVMLVKKEREVWCPAEKRKKTS